MAYIFRVFLKLLAPARPPLLVGSSSLSLKSKSLGSGSLFVMSFTLLSWHHCEMKTAATGFAPVALDFLLQ